MSGRLGGSSLLGNTFGARPCSIPPCVSGVGRLAAARTFTLSALLSLMAKCRHCTISIFWAIISWPTLARCCAGRGATPWVGKDVPCLTSGSFWTGSEWRR